MSGKHNQPAGISWLTPIHPISIKQRPNLINVLTPRSAQWPANAKDVFGEPGRSWKVQEKLESRAEAVKWRSGRVFHQQLSQALRAFRVSLLLWPHEKNLGFSVQKHWIGSVHKTLLKYVQRLALVGNPEWCNVVPKVFRVFLMLVMQLRWYTWLPGCCYAVAEFIKCSLCSY